MNLKNSHETISNASASKKPSYQAKYEITGPSIDPQNSVGELEAAKRKTMFNHFEHKNEAILVPQNGGKTPVGASSYQTKH
jgi:hypothetical protein